MFIAAILGVIFLVVAFLADQKKWEFEEKLKRPDLAFQALQVRDGFSLLGFLFFLGSLLYS